MSAIKWNKHEDSAYHSTLGGVLLIAVVYDRLGTPGWKIQVGKRSLRDKIGDLEAAKKVAIAFARNVIKACENDLETLAASGEGEGKAS